MIEFKNTDTYGFQHAIRGARNSYKSWDKSDSQPVFNAEYLDSIQGPRFLNMSKSYVEFKIGDADLALLHKLHTAGSDHAKFMRMIQVWVDINAPLYWWKEMDQYRVGQTTNSESTMHSIHTKEFTIDDFSCEQMDVLTEDFIESDILPVLNANRELFLKYRDEGNNKAVNKISKRYWWNMIQLLPSSYNQNRTVNLNYEVIAHAYKSRKGHRLDEWQAFREWAESLPYFKAIVCGE